MFSLPHQRSFTNACHLTGELAAHGFEQWLHCFTGYCKETGKTRDFFIIYYLCNPSYGSQKPVFSKIQERQSPSYLMIKAGSTGTGGAQLHKFFGWKKIDVDFGIPFSISAGEFFLSEDGLRGCIEVSPDEAEFKRGLMSDAGFMSWSLTMDKRLSFGDNSGWHAEGWVTSYSGEVIWNKEHYAVRPKYCNGYADKSWGSGLPKPWIWLSSNRLRPCVNGKILKNTAFSMGGKDNCIVLVSNGKKHIFKPSCVSPLSHHSCICDETRKLVTWHLEYRTAFSKIEIEINSRKSDMLLSRYECLDGPHPRIGVWTGGNGDGFIKYWKFGRLVADLKADNVRCGLRSEPKRNERSSKD